MNDTEPDYHPDEPLPLRDAIKAFYPRTGLKVPTLRRAISDGTLECFKFSKAYCVTKNQLDRWMETCLVKATNTEPRQVMTAAAAKSARQAYLDKFAEGHTQVLAAKEYDKRFKRG